MPDLNFEIITDKKNWLNSLKNIIILEYKSGWKSI